MKDNENIFEIGKSIEERYEVERDLSVCNIAIGRVCGDIKSTYQQPPNGTPNGKYLFWLTNGETLKKGTSYIKDNYEKVVYKNTKLGEILIKNYKGKHCYQTKTNLKKINNIEVTIHNNADYTHVNGEIADLKIWIGDDYFQFQKLSDLLQQQEKEQIELENKRLQLESLKKQIEEKKRLEDQKQIIEEIFRLEENIERTKIEIKQARSFIRSTAFLRDQHRLDTFQEDAKRSHIYDGISVLIEGGPGTGKTTTVIQRLKFLTSKEALNDYNKKLTEQQINLVTDKKSSSWMFVSPTKLLLQYLRQNMQNEGLTTNDDNSLVLSDFRKSMIRLYELWVPDKEGPFKIYKNKADESTLIVYPERAINTFEKYCIKEITKKIKEVSNLETKDYSWHSTAVRIKSYCSASSRIRTISTLLDLFYLLQNDPEIGVKGLETDLSDKVKQAAVLVKRKIVANPEVVEQLRFLFDQWRNERIIVDEDEVDEDGLASYINTKVDFDTDLFDKLRSLIRRLALMHIDNSSKLSKKQNALYGLIKPFLENIPSFTQISELAWFSKKFAFLCKGVESNVISQIVKLYKSFRKDLLVNNNQDIYEKRLLKTLIEKDNNKHLHADEQNLLLGFINNLLLGLYKKSKDRFNDLNHVYSVAYKQSVKPVLVIDEATDYSQLDYYMIYSFRHYEFSAVTLSGDIMQGLNEAGVDSWNNLNWVIPNLDKKELKISYRQLPTLLQIAKEMYKEDQGYYPEYNSFIQNSENDPRPLVFISDDEEAKIEWISHRIRDVYRAYMTMPSVAIFVGDNEDIDELIERFEDLDLLNGISIKNCSGNRLLEREDTVRVFYMHEVKGMEFEVVFFHNIDKAMNDRDSEKFMRRYLYVGISRATSHLAATFNKMKGNENIIKYFDKDGNW